MRAFLGEERSFKKWFISSFGSVGLKSTKVTQDIWLHCQRLSWVSQLSCPRVGYGEFHCLLKYLRAVEDTSPSNHAHRLVTAWSGTFPLLWGEVLMKVFMKATVADSSSVACILTLWMRTTHLWNFTEVVWESVHGHLELHTALLSRVSPSAETTDGKLLFLPFYLVLRHNPNSSTFLRWYLLFVHDTGFHHDLYNVLQFYSFMFHSLLAPFASSVPHFQACLPASLPPSFPLPSSLSSFLSVFILKSLFFILYIWENRRYLFLWVLYSLFNFNFCFTYLFSSSWS